MVRNKLYDEFEAQGYSFQRVIMNGQTVPEVFHLEDNDDWVMVNPSIVVNGKPQIMHGPNVKEITITLLNRFLEELSKANGKFIDWTSKAVIEQEARQAAENIN